MIKHRKLIQILSLLIYNADVKNWFTGNISRSPLKNVCVPGLNCYSCPGAISSCPLGAIQNTLASGKAPILITGLLLLFGTLFGRAICAFLCPVGFIQELIYKIPSPKIPKTKKIETVSQKLQKTKYIVLVLTLALPLLFYFINGFASPYFCPLGAIYSFFNKTAIFGIKVDSQKCTNCQKCTKD
ncbi:MAG: 4Fe-4S binding protein, partial [Treponema sp.]|nr:4Fe-4S binding protein [Treponema sp.]